MKQYPHYLFTKIVTPSVQDADGDWKDSSERWAFVSMCREEPNGKGTTIQVSGGKIYTFGSLIQCPKGMKGIQVGAEIMVCEDKSMSIKRIVATCMKSSVDQFHTRIWV